jgi:hypothetical protein
MTDPFIELELQLEQIGGCGDGGCIVHQRPGQHTNGGCRCSKDWIKMRRVVYAYRKAIESIRSAKHPTVFLSIPRRHGTASATAAIIRDVHVGDFIDTPPGANLRKPR